MEGKEGTLYELQQTPQKHESNKNQLSFNWPKGAQ